MKKFLFRFFSVFAAGTVVIVVFYVAVIYSMQERIREAFTLQPNETTIFSGESRIGCAVEERGGDDYRVLWKSQTPPVYSLIRLRELERLGTISQVKRFITVVGYAEATTGSAKYLQYTCPGLFPLIWRYCFKFPISAFWIPDIFYVKSWLADRSFPFEIPPEASIPIVSRDPEERNGIR